MQMENALPAGPATESLHPLQRVLYIEDDEDIQVIVKVALEDVGQLELCVCSSGRQALQEAPRFLPDLVLLDVMMPDMDGPATLDALRTLECCRELPAIFITARSQPSDIARYQGLGALGVIVKPFKAARLAAQLQDLWQMRARGARDA
jgi:two-component system OmpR family response regulator